MKLFFSIFHREFIPQFTHKFHSFPSFDGLVENNGVTLTFVDACKVKWSFHLVIDVTKDVLVFECMRHTEIGK
jgi:hypothetical protein